MPTDLLELQKSLSTAFGQAIRSPEGWGEPLAMRRALADVQQRHDNPVERVDDRSIEKSISAFRKTRSLPSFRDLKYVCLGAADANGNWRVLADRPLRKIVLDEARGGNASRQMKCFQSLLRSYWKFPLNDDALSEADKEGWAELRAWLSQRRAELESRASRMPSWFLVLGQHANLLSDLPCERYGKALLQGDGALLQEVMQGMAIPRESWVLEEAIFAQMRAGAALGELPFKEALPQLLAIASGKTGVAVSKPLAIRCLALLVARYARCASKPEHPELRDAAIAAIGNPWLRRAAWDAHVRDDRGRPHNEAREMVNGWLKRRLIRDFFELLSEDGSADNRRLAYWLRFEPIIDEMWFALGTRAAYVRGADFNDFRQRARGRLMDLTGSTAENNAFIMRMGEFVAVEFGSKGNAFFLFKWDALPPQLSAQLGSGRESGSVTIHSLKSRNNEGRMIHKSSGWQSWEQCFDDWICPLVGWKPSEKPQKVGMSTGRLSIPREPVAPPIHDVQRSITLDRIPTLSDWVVGPKSSERFSDFNFMTFVQKHALRFEDKRRKDGALWAFPSIEEKAVQKQLKAWGFQYKVEKKGWWKE